MTANELADKVETTMWSISTEEQVVEMLRSQAAEIGRLTLVNSQLWSEREKAAAAILSQAVEIVSLETTIERLKAAIKQLEYQHQPSLRLK